MEVVANIQMRKLIFATIFLIISLFVNPNTEGFTRELNKEEIKNLIRKYCKIYKLNESLVLAVVDLESGFNYNCKNSKSSAYGLFQFLQHTTEWVGKMEGYNNLTHYYIPTEIQIKLGCSYIRYLLKKYNGNEYKAMKEYSGNTRNYWKVLNKIRSKYYKIKYQKEI